MTRTPDAPCRATLAVAFSLCCVACDQEPVVVDTPATISASELDPPFVVAQVESRACPGTMVDALSFEYVLSDQERDDVTVIVEVCLADQSECGFPLQAESSDGTQFLPTTRAADGGTAHEFAWEVWRGRFTESTGQTRQRTETELDTSYVFRISLKRDPSIQLVSQAFTLSALGADPTRSCATS
ncbi:MAG: hypothetical protein AAGI01_02360 [Myxococcota bacterium]